MANNKIKFLRGTSDEYTAAKKDNDTIYFTTDDGKLYIGDKEILGESIKALNSHINDSVKHITSTERTNWNAAKTHADSAHAPSNAQANVIETVKVNGTALTPNSKSVNVTVPTKVSELTDGSNYVKTTDSRLTDARTPKAHNQASNTINVMTGYSKPSSTSAITTSDSLNTAIGKLEKALDSKQTSGSYAASNHTHDDRYYTETEINTKLNTKLSTSLKGAANGLAELDSSGKVPSAQLPSYVDDVLEYANQSSFPVKGESGKIYIAQDTNKTYRWSGSIYVEISPSLALGETSSTAYRGDRGKVAYDHSQTAHAPSSAQANVIETIKVNNTALTPTNKAVNITVPTVGNGTITIKQAGTTKGTFTTNQSGNTTINLDGGSSTVDNIDGIPVELTGIHNTQVIGYDEEQGILVPMDTVARTRTILPSAETPKIWTVTQNDGRLYEANYPGTDITGTSSNPKYFKFFINIPILLSEFTHLTIVGTYHAGSIIKISKQSDFSTVEAKYISIGEFDNNESFDITNLQGKYYIGFDLKHIGQYASQGLRITSLVLS